MKLYKYDIRDLNESEYEKWFSLMNEDKRRKVERFHFQDDKKRTVAGEMLARKAVAEWCNISEEEIIFGKKENGKPFAKNLNVHFNISHSGNVVVCAVCEKNIGIDVEQIRSIDLKIAKRIYTDDELYYLFGFYPSDEDYMKSPDGETLKRFFKLWTAKEAYLKYTGAGITENLKSLSVNSAKIQQECIDDYIITVYRD